MGLFSRNKESPILQRGYDEAYNSSLQSILKEGNHEYGEALGSWRTTLATINQCLMQVDTYNLKSSTDKALLQNIKDIERQCADRIRYLELKTGGAITTNPYGTGAPSGSSASVVKSSVSRVAVGSKSPNPPKTAREPYGTHEPVAHSSPEPPRHSADAGRSKRAQQPSKSQPTLPHEYIQNIRREKQSSSAANLAWGHKKSQSQSSPRVDDGLWSGFDGIQRSDSGASHRGRLDPSPLLESAQQKVDARGGPPPERERDRGKRQQQIAQQQPRARYVITRNSPQVRSESPRGLTVGQAMAARGTGAGAQSAAAGRRSGDLNRNGSQPERVLASGAPQEADTSLDSLSEWDRQALEKVKGLRGVDENAAKQILAEVVLKGDPVRWDDIAGLNQAKSSLKETVVYPFLRPDLFSGLREPAFGMLLFGPPGTGKTMLARAVATESHSTFFSISASSLTSKFMGESEKLVRALFQMAKALAPSIIFVDEIDSILTQRSDSGEHEASRRIKTEFLVQWSDLQAAASGKAESDVRRVLVLGATNLPWAIDEAARRRFVRRQYIPLPEDETRRAHLLKLLIHQKHALVPADVDTLVLKTRGYSGSDLTALAKDAAMGPLRSLGDALLTTDPESIRPMDLGDFVESMKTIRASVSPEGLREFEQWAENFGSSGA